MEGDENNCTRIKSIYLPDIHVTQLNFVVLRPLHYIVVAFPWVMIFVAQKPCKMCLRLYNRALNSALHECMQPCVYGRANKNQTVI